MVIITWACPRAKDAPPAPHFHTLPINRSSVWSVTPDPLRGVDLSEDVDGSASFISWLNINIPTPLFLHIYIYKEQKGYLWETQRSFKYPQ